MKKIVFLTGTRADFGKLKSLIDITSKSGLYEVHIFATGMHMNPKYGSTVHEIIKCGYENIFMYYNHDNNDTMDIILSKTINGFISFVKDIKPDLIIVHGDRVEALAGVIVGSLNNILTVHIEGGEISGTVDELIRHAISKMSHIHMVSNEEASKRLIQMGENPKDVFIIGSPDIDIMKSKRLPSLEKVKKYYDLVFDDYVILMFHPVVTEYEDIKRQAKNLVNAVLESGLNYLAIYPNNDRGCDFIFDEYKRFENNPKIRYLPSLRFEYFLVLLRNSRFIIGNSSCGIKEAPYFNIPAVNIGSRQDRRVVDDHVINCGYDKGEIIDSINKALNLKLDKATNFFGVGNSNKNFIGILNNEEFWKTDKQKQFIDILGDSINPKIKTDKKILSIITARGGSKRIPKKNIIDLSGKPLIAWTIEASIKSKYITKTVVTSEDREILNISKEYGADVIKRPKILATDSSSSESVVHHCLKEIEKKGEKYDVLILLQPTSPLRDTSDIDRAIELFLKSSSSSLISVCEPEKSPYKALRVNSKGYLEGLIDKDSPFLPAQILPKTLSQNGAIYIIYTKTFRKVKSFITNDTIPFIMPKEKSIDIDNYENLDKVRFLLNYYKTLKSEND